MYRSSVATLRARLGLVRRQGSSIKANDDRKDEELTYPLQIMGFFAASVEATGVTFSCLAQSNVFNGCGQWCWNASPDAGNHLQDENAKLEVIPFLFDSAVDVFSFESSSDGIQGETIGLSPGQGIGLMWKRGNSDVARTDQTRWYIVVKVILDGYTPGKGQNTDWSPIISSW